MEADHRPYKSELFFYRHRMGYSRKQVARLLDHGSPCMLARFERGVSLPSLLVALKLEIIYRIPVAFLYVDLYRQLKEQIRSAEDRPSGRQLTLF